MFDIYDIIRDVHKDTKIDKEIVSKVCKFVFKYTADTMKDKDNTMDILFNGLFKFKVKTRFKIK